MAKDTKEKIIDTALTCFAEKGYEGTNLQDIAESVGVVKSALYRHFDDKEEIWNTVINEMEEFYEEKFGSNGNLPKISTTCDELLSLTKGMVDFTIHDERIKKIRKILLKEQFRDEKIKTLASKHFLTDLESMFSIIFQEMMNNGSLKKDDAEILAFSYVTPISSLVHLYDREPEREDGILEKVDKFIKHFIKEYGA